MCVPAVADFDDSDDIANTEVSIGRMSGKWSMPARWPIFLQICQISKQTTFCKNGVPWGYAAFESTGTVPTDRPVEHKGGEVREW